MLTDTPLSQARWIRRLIAALFFLSVFLLVLHILPGIHAVTIEAEFDKPDRLKVYYSNSFRANAWRERFSSAPVPFDRHRQKATIAFGHHGPNSLRIDVGDDPGVVKIYRMTLHSRFAPDRVLDPREIGRSFIPGRPDVVLSTGDEYAVIRSASPDPHIVCRQRLLPRRPGLGIGISILLTAALYFCIREWRWKIRPFDNELRHEPSSDNRFRALEGLRGLAALLVVADHTWGWFRGTGTTGVWIFFVLSGFLLPRPYVNDSRRALSATATMRYYRRRLGRILPVYYFYIFIVYALHLRLNETVLHLIFLQGNGHLWAIPQIMLFYLLLPAVLIVNHLLFGNRPAVAAAAMAVLAVVCNRYLGSNVVGMLGQDYIRLRPFLGVFLAGTAFSYLYFGPVQKYAQTPAVRRFLPPAATWVGASVLVVLVFFSTGALQGERAVYCQQYFGRYGFLAALLVFCLVVCGGRGPARLLSGRGMRAVGLVGFSLYLLHPLVLEMVRFFAAYYFGYEISGGLLFLATVAGTLPLAVFTYTHIENGPAARALQGLSRPNIPAAGGSATGR